jgi:hypothetical protein
MALGECNRILMQRPRESSLEGGTGEPGLADLDAREMWS